MTTDVLRFTISGPPVPQARARSRYTGRPYTPKRSRDYQLHAASCARSAVWLTMPPWMSRGALNGGVGPFRVELDVYRVANRGDADNYAKALKDAMTKAGVWTDDRYVTELLVRLHTDKEHPRVEVSVTRLAADTPIARPAPPRPAPTRPRGLVARAP